MVALDVCREHEACRLNITTTKWVAIQAATVMQRAMSRYER